MTSLGSIRRFNLPLSTFTQTNPALWPLLVYIGVWFINDAFTMPVGSISITLNQVVIVWGIWHVISSPIRLNGTPEYWRVAAWLIVYITVTSLSMLHALIVYGLFNPNYVSVMVNAIWFLTVGRYLSQGLNADEWRLIIRVILVGTVIVFVSGMIEYVRQDHLLTTGYGVLQDQFWLRGLHIDKVDFGSSALIGILVLLGLFQTVPTLDHKLVILLAILGLALLLFFSRSWTSYAGTVVAILLVVSFRIEDNRSRNVVLLVGLIIVVGMFIFVLPQFDLFDETISLIEFKYQVQLSGGLSTNYRYISVIRSYERFLEQPIIGGGFGRGPEIAAEILDTPKTTIPHTGFATLMIEQGLVGLFPFLMLTLSVIHLFLRIWKENRWPDKVPIPIRIFLVGLAGLLLVRYVTYFFYLSLSLYFVWAALLIAVLGPRTQAQTE